MSLLDPVQQTVAELVRAPMRGAGAVLAATTSLEARVRSELGTALDNALLAAVDAALARLLADDAIDLMLARIEESGAAQRIAQRLLDDGIAEQIAERALAGPEAERLVAATLSGPLFEEAVRQLLETQAVWVLVDEIARSPSVTEAIAHQGTGFFDQVADRARERSRNADTLVQRLAGRVGRRHASGDSGEAETLPDGPAP